LNSLFTLTVIAFLNYLLIFSNLC